MFLLLCAWPQVEGLRTTWRGGRRGQHLQHLQPLLLLLLLFHYKMIKNENSCMKTTINLLLLLTVMLATN